MLALGIDASIVVTLAVLDSIWLSVQKPMYDGMVRGVQRSALKIKWVPAVAAYFLMYVALRFLVIAPLLYGGKKAETFRVFLCGALVGLCIYGIYNATNAAIFSGYSTRVALMDTAWGCILFGVTAVVAWAVAVKVYNKK